MSQEQETQLTLEQTRELIQRIERLEMIVACLGEMLGLNRQEQQCENGEKDEQL